MPSYRLEAEDHVNFEALVPDFIQLVSDIEDPRSDHLKRHSLTCILFTCLSAAMAGVKSINGFGHFARFNWNWIKTSLGSEVHDEPVSHDTIGRLLQKLHPNTLSELLTELSGAKGPRENGEQIAVDGKVVAGSVLKSLISIPRDQGGKQPVMSVNAYSVETGLVLACSTSPEPGSEHICVKEVLGLLDLRGAIVSVDAGNAYGKFTNQISQADGHWLICIKGNQAASQELCRQAFDPGVERVYDECQQFEKARQDVRQIRTTLLKLEERNDGAIKSCDQAIIEQWPHAKTLIEVDRIRRSREGHIDDQGQLQQTSHTMHYICSKKINARRAADLVRNHWHVENKIHWTLDVSYGEDASRARTGYIAENLAHIRRIAQNMLATVTGRASRLVDQMRFASDFEWRNQVWRLSNA